MNNLKKDVLQKKLNYCIDMPIKSYNYTAYMGGVLFADNQRWMPYYLSNHILLTCNDLFDVTCDDMIMYEDKDVFDRKFFGFEIQNSEEMKEDIISKINEGYYASVTVDEIFLPYRNAYEKYSFYHDILIYGYDLEKNIFYTAGYDNTEHFTCLEHNIDTIIKSILFCLRERKSKPHSHFFKAKKESKEFSLGNVKDTLRKYINSEPISKVTYHGAYGLEAYGQLIEKHMAALKDKKSLRKATFSMLIEHKEMMLERVMYINNSFGKIDDETIEMFQELVKAAKGIQLSSIKHSITHSEKIGMSISERIERLSELERNAINKLLLQM